jgi:hypothetical protein
MRQHASHVRARTIVALASLFAVFSPLAQGAPGEAPRHEVREFSVTVDGKPAGTYRMEIAEAGHDAWRMTGAADIKVRKYLVYNYRYSYNGTEFWLGDRLETLESRANDDGKNYTVRATRDAKTGALLVAVNNQQQPAMQTYVWTTTYWRLPSSQFRTTVPLIDCDTGKALTGNLQFLGLEKVNVLNSSLDCGHYGLTGGDNGSLNVELWYDGFNRLVRQITVEDNHRVVLTLSSYIGK